MIKTTTKHHKQLGDIQMITVLRGQIELVLLSYGASIYSLKINQLEISVQPDDFDDFLNASFYYGKTCGRTAGRLISPSYQIDQNKYSVKSFRGEKTKLHGGAQGFSYRHFELISTNTFDTYDQIIFRIVSEDMDEDYPGKLTLDVIYTIDENNTIKINHQAVSTKDTLCNITNHVYFNLDGEGNIKQHQIQVNASKVVVVNEEVIPQYLLEVNDTPYDLRKLTSFEKNIKSLEKYNMKGFDNAWIFDEAIGNVKLKDSKNQLSLDITTNYPAVVIFTHHVKTTSHLPNRFDSDTYQGVAIECQYEPSGIHYDGMNKAILRKNEKYDHFIKLTFNTNH